MARKAKTGDLALQNEAYQKVRTNLQYRASALGVQAIMITSAIPEEGKSTTLANLAVAIAQAGKRVLVIDADLRRPTQHRLFGLSNGPGLTEALTGAVDVHKAVRATDFDNLHVITAGGHSASPVELLESDTMRRMVNTLAPSVDYILIDAPPIIPFGDAAILSRYTQGVVLVVRAEKTPRELVMRSQKQLVNVKALILGAVLIGGSDATGRYHYRYMQNKLGEHESMRGYE